jgi:hypothetical protein
MRFTSFGVPNGRNTVPGVIVSLAVDAHPFPLGILKHKLEMFPSDAIEHVKIGKIKTVILALEVTLCFRGYIPILAPWGRKTQSGGDEDFP